MSDIFTAIRATLEKLKFAVSDLDDGVSRLRMSWQLIQEE